MPTLNRMLSGLGVGMSLCLALALGAIGCSATITTTNEPPPGTCATSASVVCVNGTTGWACKGSAEPEDSNADLVCSTDGVGDFCCATSTCSFDPNVGGCVAGTSGYSCAAGAIPPNEDDPSLVCSEPTTANNVDLYCCYTNIAPPPPASTCTEDSNVAGCAPDSAGHPSYGFSCTGPDTPDSDYSNLNCSTGTPGTNATLYCCTFH